MIWNKCIPACEASMINRGFYERLQQIEEEAEVGELQINSAYRPYEWEIKKGRTGSSSHCKGLAVDIHCANSSERGRIIMAAIQNGIYRIGIYKNFLHLDMDYKKPTPCIFLG